MIIMQKSELRKGPWIEEEDEQLAAAVAVLGDRRWDALARSSGLRRSGKSCRLRWLNYLRPDLKHGKILPEEEKIISELHEKWGNKWSKIAGRLPGRTDNEIKNYWRSHLRKKAIVKEKEYCSSSPANPSLLRSKSGTTSNCLVHDDWSLLPKDDNSRPSDLDSCDAIEGFALTTSLHETRLTEWMPSRDDLYDPGLTFDEWSTNSSWFFSLWG